MYYNSGTDVPFNELVGKTLESIMEDTDELIFVTDDGNQYRMYHDQDCCEDVSIDDICGDLVDLIGTPILSAEVATNSNAPKEDDESSTWTFYKIDTIKGGVTIRWYGSSNGYYSESVEFERIK